MIGTSKFDCEMEKYEQAKHRAYIARLDARIAESQRTRSYEDLYRELCAPTNSVFKERVAVNA